MRLRLNAKPPLILLQVLPPPSLERALAASGRPFTVLNGVSHETISLDLFGKLALLQSARTALREGTSIAGRSDARVTRGVKSSNLLFSP